MNSVLRFEKVSFAYKKNESVLEDISFALAEGTATALTGINGAGKSTITWLACRILGPRKGKIEWWGRPAAVWDEKMKRRIGLLAASDPLFEFLTIDDHLHYVGKLYGLDTGTILNRIANLKTLFGLDEFDGRLINTLSTGNRRKTGIVTTLIHRPSLLIWDEPFNGLDPIATVRLKELIKKLKTEGATLLITSQVLEPIEQVCDNILLLDRKRLVLDEPISGLEGIKERYGVNNLESLIYKIGTDKTLST
jgi:ABC-type multidrug transport system ATPase subunit